MYLKPIFYVSGINPQDYPRLSELPEVQQKRTISYFLKEQGRVSRSGPGKNFRAQVWMLKGAEA